MAEGEGVWLREVWVWCVAEGEGVQLMEKVWVWCMAEGEGVWLREKVCG